MIEIRWANQQDAEAIAGLLVERMYPEIGVHLADTLNPLKVASEILSVIDNEGAIIALDGDQHVGVLNLMRASWWFSDSEFIADQGFYVLEPYRGDVGKLLLNFAKAHAEAVGLPCFIHRFNHARTKGRVAETLHLPVGRTVKL